MKLATFFSSSTTRMRINDLPLELSPKKACIFRRLHYSSYFRLINLLDKPVNRVGLRLNPRPKWPVSLGFVFGIADAKGGVVRKNGRFHENPGYRFGNCDCIFGELCRFDDGTNLVITKTTG